LFQRWHFSERWHLFWGIAPFLRDVF
jgi:hypothetical protein